MKLYIEMDELQYERYKESLKKTRELTDYESVDLAKSLLKVIQKENGSSDNSEVFDPLRKRFKKTWAAKLTKDNFIISLIIEQYSDN